MSRIVAGIVIYKPDYLVLSKLIEEIAPEVSAIIIVTNSVMMASEYLNLQRLADQTPVVLDNPGENIGLGCAYERIMDFAQIKGLSGQADRVILFDQDSSPSRGMITALVARMDMLKLFGECPAVIGPKPVAAASNHKSPTIYYHSPSRHAASSEAVWFTISSGSLIDLAAYRQIGAFRGDFFIDCIDIEWCLRAWSEGYSCWSAEDVLMPHRLGTGYITVPLLGWKMPTQSSLRLNTYARNQAALLCMSHVPKYWKFRICAYLVVQILVYWLADRGKIARPKSMIAGFAAGIKGRLGPPPHINCAGKARTHSASCVKEVVRG